MVFWPTAISSVLQPLKHAAIINPDVLSDATEPSFAINYIDIGNVSLAEGITGYQQFRFEDAPSRARRRVKNGDVIISTVRTYLKAVACIENAEDNWVASTGFAVLRANIGTNPRYLYRVLQSEPFVNSVAATSVGVSYPAINPSMLGAIKIPLPSPKRQKRIADFLDNEIASIDKLIQRRETFLTLIGEKKSALVAEMINGSILNGPTNGCKGWFGSLPNNWKVRRAKFLFRERQDRSETGNEELLTVSHITGVTKRSEKDVNMFLAESNEGYKLVSKGDIVINTMWAWMGAQGVSPVEGLISPSYGVYEPISDNYEFEYLDLLLRSRPFIAEATRRSKGIHSSRLRLYPDAFLDILFPVPSKDIQYKILEALQAATKRDEQLAELSQQSLDRLREFRAALITAAVTGQIDVATWGKQGNTDRRLDQIEEEMIQREASA